MEITFTKRELNLQYLLKRRMMTIMMTRTSNNRPPPPATPPITFFALDDKPSTTSNNYNEYDQLNPQARINIEIVAKSDKLQLCSFKNPNQHKQSRTVTRPS